MRRFGLLLVLTAACASPAVQSPSPAASVMAAGGPYKVLRSARVGGEGGTDYINAEPATRRLYITRNAVRAVPATATTPEVAAVPGRVSVFDLDNLNLIGEVINGGGNGAVADPKSGHGFASSAPLSMFDTKTLKMMKTIDPNADTPPPAQQFQKDGIYFDDFNDRVYIFSHPTKNAIVLDSHNGNVIGKIDLGGVPEQAVGDGKGTLYVVMQDAQGSVAVVDVKTMKTTAHYPFDGQGSCNGLGLDVKNKILFAACARTSVPGAPAPTPGATPPPPNPTMVILSAVDGKILAKLPLAGSSDGAVFNPATNEAFSAHGNGTLTIVKEMSPTRFEVEQNLNTMNGARTLTLDTKTGRIFVMSVERGAAPPPPPGGGRGGQAPVIPGSFTIVMVGK